MHTLARNKKTLYYALYQGKTAVVDANGMQTGEYSLTYANPVETKMYVSASRGSATEDMFGIDVKYERVAITDDMNCPLAEDSIVWIDKATNTAHNFVVVQVAKSYNHISYALREVNAS